MKTFNEYRDLNKTNVDKVIRHDWATHIKHPSLGEEFVKVKEHSLNEDGVIDEYYVMHNDNLVTIKAEEVTESHGGTHSHKAKKKK